MELEQGGLGHFNPKTKVSRIVTHAIDTRNLALSGRLTGINLSPTGFSDGFAGRVLTRQGGMNAGLRQSHGHQRLSKKGQMIESKG
ncbi:MAG: hypothetical protein WCI11_01135 [Candidatus Methylumidiphilus sp.]